MSDKPLLFSIVRRGYDPAEVTECYLILTQSFEKYVRNMEAEKEYFSKEALKWCAMVEEVRECEQKLADELAAERRKNARLLLELTHYRETSDPTLGAKAEESPGGQALPDFKSGW